MSKSITSIARHDRIRREVLSKSDMIPSLPEVVMEVMRMLNDADSSISDFETPLSQDAALVARMLKLVNSPFYGVGRQVSTIGDSITILGFRSLRSMVLAASTGNFLERDFSCYGHDEKGLWHHSICVASGAKCLATHLGTDPNFRGYFWGARRPFLNAVLLGPGLGTSRHVPW